MEVNAPLRWLELVVLFGCAPFLLTAPIPVPLIIGAILLVLGYCFWLMRKQGMLTRGALLTVNWRENSKLFLVRFVIFAVASTVLVAVFVPETLFKVVLNNPLLWIAISVFYAVFSVYPQELLYRHFFFQRYQCLFANTRVAILCNAALFCLAHVVFDNLLVFALTFAGGFLFAYTYCSKKSLMLTSIEHALYGVWLFTLGIGDMLAFPGP